MGAKLLARGVREDGLEDGARPASANDARPDGNCRRGRSSGGGEIRELRCDTDVEAADAVDCSRLSAFGSEWRRSTIRRPRESQAHLQATVVTPPELPMLHLLDAGPHQQFCL